MKRGVSFLVQSLSPSPSDGITRRRGGKGVLWCGLEWGSGIRFELGTGVDGDGKTTKLPHHHAVSLTQDHDRDQDVAYH